MKTILAAAAALAMTAIAAPAMAAPAPVEKLTSAGPDGKPGAILKGAIVPPGYDTFYLSGQLADPIDPAKKATADDYGDTKTQTVSTLTKIKALLEEKGYKMSDVIKMTAFLTADPKLGRMDFKGYMEGFLQFFNTTENPNTVARSTVMVAALVQPMYLVELEVTAVKPAKK
ncbi:MAG: RidA family protein [Rhizorhabdus sp.]